MSVSVWQSEQVHQMWLSDNTLRKSYKHNDPVMMQLRHLSHFSSEYFAIGQACP